MMMSPMIVYHTSSQEELCLHPAARLNYTHTYSSSAEIARLAPAAAAAVNAAAVGLQDGRTPLHVACEHGHMEAAAALIGLGGADLSARDNAGLTALHVAVDKNHLALAKTLMDRGATVDTATNVS